MSCQFSFGKRKFDIRRSVLLGSRSFPDSARLRFAPWDALLARFGHGATEPRGDTEKRHVGALQLENSASIILIDAHPAMPTSRRPRRRVHFGDAVVVEEPRRRPLGQSVHIMTGLTPGTNSPIMGRMNTSRAPDPQAYCLSVAMAM